jgi:hypothetical protein
MSSGLSMSPQGRHLVLAARDRRDEALMLIARELAEVEGAQSGNAERACVTANISISWGRSTEAKVVFAELLVQMKRAPRYVRQAQADWLSIAEKRLAT